ncbi:MAG: hypothetical protein HYW48_05865 [Deltaproteobacteria bacterium]|nr:hypothetical protein [Deltaproteobacteria bacterium]
MEEPAAQFPPNHLLALSGLALQLNRFFDLSTCNLKSNALKSKHIQLLIDKHRTEAEGLCKHETILEESGVHSSLSRCSYELWRGSLWSYN